MTLATPSPAPSHPPLAIIGMGKMGRALDTLATEHGWPVVARIDVADGPVTRELLGGARVAIEFTAPAAAPGNIRACVAAGCAVVVGTTGWYGELPTVAGEVRRGGGAMLWAPNFSVGANVLIAAATHAARLLRATGLACDAHIVETHHAAKLDAPSGTARAIEQAVARAWGASLPVTSVRVGWVPGVHEVIFDAAFEQLRFEHVARDRRVFAEGALAAAAWLAARTGGGVFTMQDVVTAPDRSP